MRSMVRFLIGPLLLIQLSTFNSSSQVPPPREARVGDVATGVVIYEDQDELRLDMRPCSREPDKQILLFRYPYKKTAAGSVECSSGTYDRVQVVQQSNSGQGYSPPRRGGVDAP